MRFHSRELLRGFREEEVVVEEIQRNLNWVCPLRLSSTDKWNEEDYGEDDEDHGMHPSQRRISRIRICGEKTDEELKSALTMEHNAV